MSHGHGSNEQELNQKKRRWKSDHASVNEDDGEIPESDTHITHAAAVEVKGSSTGKRLRPSMAVADSYTTDYYRAMEVSNNNRLKGGGIVKNTEKKSREELERERQIRMAAIRGGNETEVVTSNRRDKNHSNDPTTPQDSSFSKLKTLNQKNRKKAAKKKDRGDALNYLGGETVEGDLENDDDDDEEEEEHSEEDDTAKAMEELFGITNFGSTKNTKVTTNHTSAAMGTIAKHLKPRKYRQYMNRKNGFNRPLDNV